MQVLGKIIRGRGVRCLTSPCEFAVRGHRLLANAAADEEILQSIYEKVDQPGVDHKFIDKVRIRATAGAGGSGCDSIWKSNKKGKFKPPDGGSGGRGGDVIVIACSTIKDLSGIRFVQKAGRGGQGRSQKQAGARGTDRIIEVPADVGFVGAPNAGKSTLLRALSNARPRVGDFAFTTLQPQLGVVPFDEGRMVVADIPGLIAGASGNRGLGHSFLRHIERTGMLAFVLDISSGQQGDGGLQPCEQLRMLQRELCLYSPALLQKPALVVANKVDSLEGHASAQALMTLQQSTDLPVLAVSGLQQTNISELRDALLHHDLHCASKHMATIEVAKE
ncbi:hypothetical protein WJX75_004336 [Coccomyxa subellipsoidea]|uniref:P-loop containing nucleoside triphosphate hydrolase protein n=1 Tax=Coccomyxa subellipsoidea TaxID=248742 RepID=A0ABR2YVU6_9CHLO